MEWKYTDNWLIFKDYLAGIKVVAFILLKDL
jgi:hypothetical protein